MGRTLTTPPSPPSARLQRPEGRNTEYGSGVARTLEHKDFDRKRSCHWDVASGKAINEEDAIVAIKYGTADLDSGFYEAR